MRLSELMQMDAMDREGNDLGHVRDVRLEGHDGGWEVTALILGDAAVAERLGFVYGVVERPALLATAMRWLARHARVAPWEKVRLSDQGHIVVDARGDELMRPGVNER